MARRNIHTYKSPRGLFQHSPEMHSHSQIPEAPASVHGRGNGIGLGMTTRRKRYCFQTGDDGNDDDDDWLVRVSLPDLEGHDADDDLDLGLEQVSLIG